MRHFDHFTGCETRIVFGAPRFPSEAGCRLKRIPQFSFAHLASMPKGKKGGAPTVTVSLRGRAPNRFLTLLVLLRVPTHVLTDVFTGHQAGGNKGQHLLRLFAVHQIDSKFHRQFWQQMEVLAR
jgi:hypothetical protein